MTPSTNPLSSAGLPDRVVIVGASAGGLATAEALRRQSYRGTLTFIGDEPHLPYDRPPLSKQFLRGEWQPERLRLRPPAEIDALDIDLRLGTSTTSVDRDERTVTLSDGQPQPYDALVVATGVRPRRLPDSTGVSGVHVLRTLEDATVLKTRLTPGRRLVVVGAGFIGAEAAAAARRLGIDVTMIEPAPIPLAHAVGEAVGRALTRPHLDHGVDLRTGATVSEVLSYDGQVTGVGLADGTAVPADDVVVGIGSHPNVEWLEGPSSWPTAPRLNAGSRPSPSTSARSRATRRPAGWDCTQGHRPGAGGAPLSAPGTLPPRA